MGRVAEAWNALDDEQQLAASSALRTTLGEPGVRLILAIARDAQPPPPAEPGCDNCHTPAQLTAFVADDRTVQLLCGTCWTARMHARARTPMQPGDVQQPFPSTHPLEHP